MAINLYSKASVDSLLAGKLSVSSLSNGAATAIDSTVPTAGKVLSFDGTNLKWVTAASGATWGSITGTLSSQSDLNTALNARVSTAGDTMDNNALLEFNDTTSNSTLGINGNGVVTTLAPSPGEYSQLTYDALLITDGADTMTMGPSGLTFPDSSVQTTAYTGGATWLGSRISIYGGYLYDESGSSYVNTLTLYGASSINAQNFTIQSAGGGVLTFADGTTMATKGLIPSNNLSDLSSASTARTNLGLGTMAVETATDYLTKAGNLSGLASTSTARTNLGLGTAAVESASRLIPTGGTTGQVLSKVDGTNYNVTWTTAGGGGSGGVDIQTFGSSTTSGTFTWTKPAGAKWVEVILYGPGTGGGSGGKFATTSGRSGGSGGGGGTMFYGRIGADALGATESVIVGSGGVGGVAQTIDNGNGNSPTGGNTATRFYNFKASGGYGGNGGGTSSASAVAGKASVAFLTSTTFGQSGAGTINTGSDAPQVASGINLGCTGGGGGGGAGASSVLPGGGGSGGNINTSFAGIFSIISGGAGGTSAGVAATNGTSATNLLLQGGTGGGGGFYRTGQSGGTGGNGGWPGGGGGGGGAADNGVGISSGAGGDGANGFAVIITYF